MLELGGAVVSVLDRSGREDVRLHQPNTSIVDLPRVRRSHSPLVAMHHMILRVRRKFFEIATKPSNRSTELGREDRVEDQNRPKRKWNRRIYPASAVRRSARIRTSKKFHDEI